MTVYYVHVGVALQRPPGAEGDEIRRYAVEAGSTTEALEIAEQMASCTSVMPVWGVIDGDEWCLTPRQEWKVRTWGVYDKATLLRNKCDCGHGGRGMAWHDRTCPAYNYLKGVLF